MSVSLRVQAVRHIGAYACSNLNSCALFLFQQQRRVETTLCSCRRRRWCCFVVALANLIYMHTRFGRFAPPFHRNRFQGKIKFPVEAIGFQSASNYCMLLVGHSDKEWLPPDNINSRRLEEVRKTVAGMAEEDRWGKHGSLHYFLAHHVLNTYCRVGALGHRTTQSSGGEEPFYSSGTNRRPQLVTRRRRGRDWSVRV